MGSSHLEQTTPCPVRAPVGSARSRGVPDQPVICVFRDGLVLGKLRLGGVWFMVTCAAWPQPKHCDWELCVELGRCFSCHLTPLDTPTPKIGFGLSVQSTELLLVPLALDNLCIC